MRATKTIRCNIWKATKAKRDILEEEYNNLQLYLQTGIDDGLYSANKQQAERFYKEIKKGKEYPISIRNDLIKIEKKDTKLVKYWIRIPVRGRRGGLWLPVKPHCEFPDEFEISESKLVKKKNGFSIHVTISKDIPQISCSHILAVDLGERYIAVACGNFDNQRPRFYGKEVRGIRRHYAWLRKRLGKKKLLREIKRIGQKERRVVDSYLHEIAKDIVFVARKTNSIIVLGDLKGIRDSAKGKGRRFNRIVANMPYYRLSEFIKYKAAWLGVPVVIRKEYKTSITCHRCGVEGKRLSQARFKCDNCNLDHFNADVNGVRNHLQRELSYTGSSGASVNMPVTGPFLVSPEAPCDSWG
jgi:putative transposase